MDFALWRLSETDLTKMVSYSADAGGCAARVAFRQEFGVRTSNEVLCQLATQRGANWKTLSEKALSYSGFSLSNSNEKQLNAKQKPETGLKNKTS